MSGFKVSVRKQIEVNTDPQRRCYHGCHAKSEMVWTEWAHICTYSTREDADESAALFKSVNPTREYKVEEVQE
jgi:hypothetical protein